MHCSDESCEKSQTFLPGPSLEEFEEAAAEADSRGESVLTDQETGKTYNYCLVPKCSQCGQAMKPHCMFFDEYYNEHFWRQDTVNSFLEQTDCLIVVGTALATNFAETIVVECLEKEIPVIEINLETSIDCGKR